MFCIHTDGLTEALSSKQAGIHSDGEIEIGVEVIVALLASSSDVVANQLQLTASTFRLVLSTKMLPMSVSMVLM